MNFLLTGLLYIIVSGPGAAETAPVSLTSIHAITMNEATPSVSSRPVLGNRTMDLTGHKYGRLTVLHYTGKNKHNQTLWECECECGTIVEVEANSLRSGNTKACGCLSRDIAKSGDHSRKHGMRRTPEYYIWCSMKARCNNPNTENYARYGGVGIKVCDSWNDSFESFFSDMGLRPTSKHSIERIDCGGDYYPENCKWIPLKDQSKNRKNCIRIAYNGKEMILKEWANALGFNYMTLYDRIRKHGWSVEKAFTTPA
jgi:hypothetical protein